MQADLDAARAHIHALERHTHQLAASHADAVEELRNQIHALQTADMVTAAAASLTTAAGLGLSDASNGGSGGGESLTMRVLQDLQMQLASLKPECLQLKVRVRQLEEERAAAHAQDVDSTERRHEDQARIAELQVLHAHPQTDIPTPPTHPTHSRLIS